MRMITIMFFFSAVTAKEMHQHQTQSTPVQKVLQMMADMKQKAIHEKNEEEVGFAKFSTFCENTDKSKTKAIADGKAAEEQLTADIMKYESDAKVLGEEIAKLDGAISLAEEDKAKTSELRAEEHADYEKTHAEYVENIDDLAVGTEKLKTMMNHAPGAAASLIQTMASKMTLKHTKTTLLSFLAESESSERMLAQDVGLEVTAPEAAVYEGQSGGIIDMMEQLSAKLEDEKETLEKEEANARHSANMMLQSLTDKIEQDMATRKSKVSSKKGKESAAGEAKGELAETQATLAEDTKYLEDLKELFEQKKTDFAARQELRQGEMEALDKAIEIISSGAVSGAADTHLPGLVQIKTALVQLRSGAQQPSQKAVAQFLQAQGKRMNSQLLAALAVRVQQDPFGKVKKMIKDMIIKLTEEATEEAEHKGFCDTELTTNKQTRDFKTTTVAELTAEIEQLTAESQKLAAENADLTKQIEDIDVAVAEATATRNAEKAKNAATLSDAVAAKAAVESAMSVLKTFYDKAAKATAFVSQAGPIDYDDRAIGILNRASLLQTKSKTRGPADDVPETFDKPFTGMGGEGGILGMLEVILSDFERLEEETSTSEATAKKDHDTFLADSSEDKAVKTANVNHNENRITKLNSDNASAKKDLKATQAELDAALEYYEKLKPSCVDAGESYEERVKRREDEIQSLKEALDILAP